MSNGNSVFSFTLFVISAIPGVPAEDEQNEISVYLNQQNQQPVRIIFIIYLREILNLLETARLNYNRNNDDLVETAGKFKLDIKRYNSIK